MALLSNFQKFFKTKAGFVPLEQLLNSLTNFMAPILVAHFDGVAGAAVYFIMFAFVTLHLTILRGIITVPLPYFEKHRMVPSYYSHLSILASIGITIFIIGLLGKAFYAKGADYNDISTFLLIGVGAALYIKESVRSILLALGWYRVGALTTLLVFFYLLIAWVYALRIGTTDPVYLFLFQFVAFIPLVVVIAVTIRTKKNQKREPLHFSDFKSTVSNHVRYGVFSTVNNFLQSLVLVIIYARLETLDPMSVAILGAITSFVNLASPIYQALNTYLSRFFVHCSDDYKRLWQVYKSVNFGMIGFAFCYLSFIYFFGLILLGMLYEFSDMVGIKPLLFAATGFALQGFGFPASRLMSAIGHPSVVLSSGMIYSATMFLVILLPKDLFTLEYIFFLIMLSRLCSTLYLLFIVQKNFKSVI